MNGLFAISLNAGLAKRWGDGIKILSVRTLYKSTLFTIYAEFVLIFH
jgi:hypothetical protein